MTSMPIVNATNNSPSLVGGSSLASRSFLSHGLGISKQVFMESPPVEKSTLNLYRLSYSLKNANEHGLLSSLFAIPEFSFYFSKDIQVIWNNLDDPDFARSGFDQDHFSWFLNRLDFNQKVDGISFLGNLLRHVCSEEFLTYFFDFLTQQKSPEALVLIKQSFSQDPFVQQVYDNSALLPLISGDQREKVRQFLGIVSS